MEFLKTLPNFQFARGWRDLPLAWLWAEQQEWAWWRLLQSTPRQLSWYPLYLEDRAMMTEVGEE